MDDKILIRVIRKFLNNDLPQDVQLRFRRWFMVHVDEELRENELKTFWEESSSEKATEFTQQQWDKLSYFIESEHRKLAIKNRILRTLKIAAIICLPLFTAGLSYLYTLQHPIQQNIELTQSFSRKGERRQITLPDGSLAWINAESVIIYPKQFDGNTRTVFLNGEARFKVVKNPQKAFIVKTAHLEVEALGTVFNVSCRSDESYTIATLEQGSIRVCTVDSTTRNFILKPNQQIRYENSTGLITQQTVEAEHVGLWRNGQLYFQATPFNEVIKSLERRYNVTFYYEPSKFKQHLLTIKFTPDETIEDALNVIQGIIPNMKYLINEKNITIK